jgi:hypothetical protein
VEGEKVPVAIREAVSKFFVDRAGSSCLLRVTFVVASLAQRLEIAVDER